MDIEPITPGRVMAAIGICAAFCVAAMISMPLLGSAHIEFGRAFRGESPDAEILFRTRCPRIILAALAGGPSAATWPARSKMRRSAYMPAKFRSCVTEITSIPPLHKPCRMR